MLLKPGTILALRHNGTALHLTVERLDNITCNLTAQGRGTFHLTSSKLGPDPIRTLHTTFAHYPNPVTINNEPVDRTPFPNHASVRIAHAPDMDRSNTRISPYALDERTRNQGDLNTYASGILSDITRDRRVSQVYWAKLPSQHEHWSHAATVFVTPVYVLSNQELDSLDTDHFNNHRDAINDRADAQVEETMKHPNMPHFYMDEPFHHIIGAPVYSDQARNMGAPIYVHGIPATFSAMTPSPSPCLHGTSPLPHQNRHRPSGHRPAPKAGRSIPQKDRELPIRRDTWEKPTTRRRNHHPGETHQYEAQTRGGKHPENTPGSLCNARTGRQRTQHRIRTSPD